MLPQERLRRREVAEQPLQEFVMLGMRFSHIFSLARRPWKKV
jgi:hypothetical protein